MNGTLKQKPPKKRRRVLYVKAGNELTDQALAEHLNRTGGDADIVIRYHKKTGDALPLRRVPPIVVQWLRETAKENPEGVFQFNVYVGWEDERTVEKVTPPKSVRASDPVRKARADRQCLAIRKKKPVGGKRAGKVSPKPRS